MKKLFVLVILVLMFSVPSWADTISPRITVFGTAVIKVVPDEMYWSVKVLNKGPAIDSIAAQHIESIDTLLMLLKNTGIPEKKVQTSMMQFNENWQHIKGKRVQDGYYASSQVAFKLMDFDKYQFLWQNLSEMSEVSIQNISYGYSKQGDVQNKNRINALINARDKARAMASTLSDGRNILGSTPIFIEEIQSNSNGRPKMLMAADAGFAARNSGSTGFSLGEIEIKNKVKVAYPLAAPNFKE